MRRALLATILQLVFFLVAGSEALGFDRTEKHVEHGFSVDRPSHFEARPLPPEEIGVVAIYAPKDAPTDRRSPVTHRVYAAEGVTSAAEVHRWALENLQPGGLEAQRSVRQRYGRKPARLTGTTFDEDGMERSLFVHAWLGAEDAIIFVGECEPGRLRREKRSFDRVSMSFRFFTQGDVAKERAKWEKHYRRSGLAHAEKRVEVALAMVDGWCLKDTKHSVILYHGSANEPLLEQFAVNLVAVRKRFEEDFPPDRPIDALSVVRVCRDRGEYLTYGGNPGTVGYFYSAAQELVLYDARANRTGPMPNDHPTMQTLYHEACHQFLYHTASALSPHSWYDEGTAEFYSGSVIELGKVQRVEGLDERERFLRGELSGQRIPKLETLMRMTQQEFYAEADINYSTGYALIRFLRTSRAASARPAWSSLPTRYFETLRQDWRREAEGLALSGLSGSKYRSALSRSREKALLAALEGVDISELEAAFLEWIRLGA